MSAAAAQTAVGPIVIVALDQHEDSPLVHDGLARKMVSGVGRLAVTLGSWSPIRRLVFTATENKIPGLWASMLCRKRYIDEKLLTACDAGIDAVVILGAGFDTRAHRLPIPPRTPVYEVDLPRNIERKRARLTTIYGGAPPESVRLVPIDFETQALGEVLAEHGYQRTWRTFFVWEAVTQYLTEVSVRDVLEFLGSTARGSEVVFTYIRQDFLEGTAFYGAESAHREFVVKRRLWRFGLLPEHVADFVQFYGWTELEQMGHQEYTDRYVAPSHRALPVSAIERAVHAVRA
ncbi:SAM-dependent methyltransferase [Actinosynnema sp. ALI-1.44]|uniref:SAM-dependent methyltransferase n=1 Tax=Actinosynnema sp. ALI-1.44 TaxID=1933779 RepID=UPI00097BF000|nr:SAM-dependent methyltransferase [Actinosynnema sp. ALI-1.44]ONI85419.1 SAM-dependent methyltransferase [Actinosynnema sp. ALI-1.44]